MPDVLTTPKKSRPQVACVYLGAARKAELAERANRLGYRSLSEYLCALVDYGIGATKEQLEKRRKNDPKGAASF